MNDKDNGINRQLQPLRTKTKTQLARLKPAKYPFVAPIIEELLHEPHVHQIELKAQNEELRRASIALEASRSHYVELYDFAPVGYLTLVAKDIIAEINLTAAKFIGVERKYLINQHFGKFIADEFRDCWHQNFLRATQNIGKHACELPFRYENGNIVYLHLECLYIDLDNTLPHLRVTLTNITERKQTEEALRIAAVAFETLGGIIVADANKVILRVNQAFSRITGYSAEDAIGNTPAILRSDLHDEGFYQNIWSSVERDGYWEGEVWEKHKNGKVLPVWLAITAVTNADKHITHYVGSFLDITVQKQAEKVLLDARLRLENQVATTQEELEKIKEESLETNAAMQVLLKYRDTDKSDAKIAFSQEVESTILPFLKKLKGTSTGRHQTTRLVNILEANLEHLVESYGHTANLAAAYQHLTPVETQVASLVRQGLSTKVIAATLAISAGTVGIHRKHIRKKLGLDSKGTNLHSYLLSLTE